MHLLQWMQVPAAVASAVAGGAAAVVFRGEGGHFCAGADLGGMADNASYAEVHDARGELARLFLDLDAVGKQLELPQLEHMHVHKTGALIECAVALGARRRRA